MGCADLSGGHEQFSRAISKRHFEKKKGFCKGKIAITRQQNIFTQKKGWGRGKRKKEGSHKQKNVRNPGLQDGQN